MPPAVYLIPTSLVSKPSVRVQATYRNNLSCTPAPLPNHLLGIFADPISREIYLSDLARRMVHVFDENGLEVRTFGDDPEFGAIYDGVVGADGGMLLLTYKGPQFSLVRCDYRGEPISEGGRRNFPKELDGFSPTRMILRNQKLYFASLDLMMVAVTDENGVFEGCYDIASQLGMTGRQRTESGLGGFDVDREGNLLFTIPVHFSVYRLSPCGQRSTFGAPGTSRGRFAVVSGIAADDRCNHFVADKLKRSIIVLDRDLEFLTEFSYGGQCQENLSGPVELAIVKDKLYITQSGQSGASVYDLSYD